MTTKKFDPKKCSLRFHTEDGIRIALRAESITYEPMRAAMTTKTLDQFLIRPESATGKFIDDIAGLPERQKLTIAQSIRRSSDPYHAAVASFTRRDVPHGQSKHVYYFEDGSSLTFEVTYTAIDDSAE